MFQEPNPCLITEERGIWGQHKAGEELRVGLLS